MRALLLFAISILAAVPAAAQTAAPTTVPEMWDAWCARCHAKDGSGKVCAPTVTVEPMDVTDWRIACAEPDADSAPSLRPSSGATKPSPGMMRRVTYHIN